MKLREVQRLMWRAMTWPTGVEAFVRDADEATRLAFAEAFGESPAFPRTERIDVYAQSYYWRLEEVLRDQFRVTAWVAGDVEFHNLCTDYVLAMPSRRPDVRRFAAPLCDYLAAHPLAARIVGIEDVARIEWGAVRAIDAADVTVWTTEALEAVPLAAWPALRLQAIPGASLHTCRLPYAQMWADRAEGSASPASPPRPQDPPHAVLVWRKGLEVFHRTVTTQAEMGALAALLSGVDFAQLVEDAQPDLDSGEGADPAEVGAQVVGWLRRWLRDELLAAPETGAPGCPLGPDAAD